MAAINSQILTSHRQVFLPAIVGYVPDEMVHTVSSFMDFCYYVRQPVIDEDTLRVIDTTLANVHKSLLILVSESTLCFIGNTHWITIDGIFKCLEP